MEERKCFVCGGFGYITHHCRNIEEERLVQMPLNRFEALRDRLMQRGEGSESEIGKDRKMILREEKAKRGIEVQKTEVEKKKKKEEKKKKLLREVMVKIGLKQEEEEEEIVVDALLDSGVTGLVMSDEFVRKHKFRRTKLERLIYVRNVNGMFNYAELIVDTVEVEIYFRRHKERMSIDVIGGQKWGVILGIPWLAYHNLEINWRMGEVQMTRCPEECEKK